MKEMATHSINLAWEIPWTEEPRGLPSMGHNELHMHMCVCACTQSCPTVCDPMNIYISLPSKSVFSQGYYLYYCYKNLF